MLMRQIAVIRMMLGIPAGSITDFMQIDNQADFLMALWFGAADTYTRVPQCGHTFSLPVCSQLAGVLWQ
jgi:hypothetical protein